MTSIFVALAVTAVMGLCFESTRGVSVGCVLLLALLFPVFTVALLLIGGVAFYLLTH